MWNRSPERGPRTAESPGRSWLEPAAAVWVLVAVGVVADVRLLFAYWPGSFFDGLTSGVWTGLAWDAAHGVLYRPLVGPAGYGGTRYMPLFFLAHGLLIRARQDPVYAGVALMQASVAAAALAVFVALRRLGVARRLAAPLAATVWATVIFQKYCTDAHADYLAAALAMLGLAFAAQPSRPGVLGSAAAIVLGAFSKMTAIGFAAPVALWLTMTGRRSAAVRFAVATVALAALGVLVLQIASAGHFLENILATATGGMSGRDVRHAAITFGREVGQEPFVGVPFVLGTWSLYRARGHWSLAHAYFLAAALVTMAIFASPGTASNHLVDLQMAGAVVVGVALQDAQLPRRPVAFAYLVLALVLAAISWPIPGVPSVVTDLRSHGPRSRATVQAIHAEYLASGAPYISLDPIVPVLNGERPLVQDPFNLKLFVEQGTPAGRDLARRIRRHDFSAVVLRENAGPARDIAPADSAIQAFRERYWRDHQDDPLLELFHTAYDIQAVHRPFIILLPRR